MILVIIWALFYFQQKWLRQSEQFDQANAMMDQRVNMAITDAFLMQLQRAPTATEMSSIANEIKPKLNGMPMGKDDLTKFALGIVKSRGIKK